MLVKSNAFFFLKLNFHFNCCEFIDKEFIIKAVCVLFCLSKLTNRTQRLLIYIKGSYSTKKDKCITLIANV